MEAQLSLYLWQSLRIDAIWRQILGLSVSFKWDDYHIIQQPLPFLVFLSTPIHQEGPCLSVSFPLRLTADMGTLIAYRLIFLRATQKTGGICSVDLLVLSYLEKNSHTKKFTYLVTRSHLASSTAFCMVFVYWKHRITHSVSEAKLIQYNYHSLSFCRTK